MLSRVASQLKTKKIEKNFLRGDRKKGLISIWELRKSRGDSQFFQNAIQILTFIDIEDEKWAGSIRCLKSKMSEFEPGVSAFFINV